MYPGAPQGQACDTHTIETELQCSSDVYTCMPLVPPRGPRDLPTPLSQGGITWRETRSLSWGRGFFVDLDRGLLHGDGRGLLMGVNAATSGGADVIFMDLEIVALSRTPSARVFAQVCTRLPSARKITHTSDLAPHPPLFYQAGVINITVGMFFIMGSDMLFFMGSARYSPRIAV